MWEIIIDIIFLFVFLIIIGVVLLFLMKIARYIEDLLKISRTKEVVTKFDVNISNIPKLSVNKILEPMSEILNLESVESFEATNKDFSKEQLSMFALTSYFSEVHNGGHAQLFDNPSILLIDQIHEGFVFLNRKDLVTIFEEALNVFPNKNIPQDIAARREVLDKIGEPLERKQEELDQKFWKESKTLEKEIKVFILNNKDKFVFTKEVKTQVPRKLLSDIISDMIDNWGKSGF